MDALGFATSGAGKGIASSNGTQKNINTIAARAAPALRGIIGQGNDASYNQFLQGKNPSIYKDVPSLNAALKGGQINKNQWQSQFRVIADKAQPTPKIKTGWSALPGVLGSNVPHQVARVSNDVSGGTVNQFARAVVNTPIAVAREVQNKPITDIQKNTFGTTDSGSIAKKIIGSTAGTATMFLGAGQAGATTAALSKTALARQLALQSAKNAAISAGANTAATITNNPNATGKQLLKSASLGAAGGVALTAGGKAAGTALQRISSKVAARSNVPAATSALHLPGKNMYAEISPTLQAHLNNEVENMPFTKGDMPHLTPLTKLEKAGVQKVSLAQLSSESPNVTQALRGISKRQPLGETGGVTLPTTNDYVKQQIKLQDSARKAGSKNPVLAAKSEAKQKLVDSFAPIEDTLNKSKAKVVPENNIKYQIDRAIRGDTIGAQYIKDNGLAKVIQSAPNTKELDQYLIAKHAADLEKNGIQTGRNLPADQQLIKDLGPKYEQHAQAIKQYSNNLLDTATNYGLVSKDLAAHLKQKYPNYVPVNRIFGEGELPGVPKGVGQGMASLGSQNVVQKIKGSTRQIESPLSNLVDKTVDVVKQGERNKAAQILTGYKDLPGNPFQLRELSKDEVVGNKPVISFLDKGVQRRFETTPEISAAAKALNKEQLGLIGKILSVPTRVLRLGATGLNPAFALSNVTKDTVSAFINSNHALRASPANPKVFMQSLIAAANHGSKQYGELVREGAGGTSFDIARNAPKQNIKAIRAERNLPSKIAFTVTRPAQLLRAAENTIGRSEEFNRAIQYFGNKEAFAKKGYNAAQTRTLAADAARNNTVNFARAGDYGRVVNSTLPYFNAGIQGSRTFLRNLKDRPLQTGTKLAVSTFFPVAAVTAWNTSDPKRKAAYDDIKDYEKQGNLVIMPPHPVKDPKTGQWNVIKIPMSQEIANLASVVRNGTEVAVKDGKLNVAQMLGNTAGTVTSLNTQSPRQLANQLTPQAIKPGIESLVNQNLYTGNKIVPDSQRNLPAKDQTGPGTSKLAIKVGQVTNLSPRQIDNAISTGTGGLGKNIVHGKSLPDQINARFKGAQGNSPYDLATARFNSLKTQLTALPGYKSMSSQDKAKALNRLESAVNGALVPAPGKKLSPRQRAIVNKNPDLASYLKAKR